MQMSSVKSCLEKMVITIKRKKKDFKSETVTGDKGHYIVIKGSVHQGDSNYTYTHIQHQRTQV